MHTNLEAVTELDTQIPDVMLALLDTLKGKPTSDILDETKATIERLSKSVIHAVLSYPNFKTEFGLDIQRPKLHPKDAGEHEGPPDRVSATEAGGRVLQAH